MAVRLTVVGPASGPSDIEEEALGALDRDDRRGALTVLMRGYGDAVYQFCRRTLRDEALAEDVHQQTFVQAYEDLPRFSRRSSLKTWLFGIAHHRCLDAAKGRRRFLARFSAPEKLPDHEDSALAGEEKIQRNTVAQALLHCLQQLAPATKIAVTLRYTEGFTFEEMSSICGEKAGTLQARVARAMPVIRKCLETRGISP